MDLLFVVALAATGAYMLNTQQQRRRIVLLAQHLQPYQIERLMETLTQGYLRAMGEQDPESKAMVQSMLNQIQYRFTLNLPVKPETQNADSVSSDGKSLTWDLKATIAEGKDVQMQASYRIYNQAHIALTVGGIVLALLLAGGFLYLRRRKQADELT